MGKRKKAKKAKEEESEGFPVEVITKARVVPVDDDDVDEVSSKTKEKRRHQDAKWEYYVKWAGYGEDQNSWEPEENLESCERLLASFWRHVGMDDEDYPIGYVVKAKKSWIKAEMEYFAKESRNLQEEIRRREKEHDKSKKIKKEKQRASEDVSSAHSKERSRSKSTVVSTRDNESSVDSDDDRPLSLSASSLKTKVPRNRKRKLRVSSSSSEEEPLRDVQGQGPSKKAKVASEQVIEVENHPPPGSPTSLFSERSSPETALASIIPVTAPQSEMSPSKDVPSLSAPPIRFTSSSTNPQAKLAMSSSVAPSGSGISTKQRLAQAALTMAPPKDIGSSTSKPKPKSSVPLPTRTTSNPLGNLSFKKSNPPTPIVIPSGTVSTTQPALTQPPLFHSADQYGPPTATFESPVVEQHQRDSVLITPAERSASINKPSTVQATTSPLVPMPVDDNMAAAEDFLQGIMPSAMAAPLLPAGDQSSEISLPKSLHTKAPPIPPGRIPKLWKWSGPLKFKEHKEPICNVKLHSLTKDQSLRFSIVFQKVAAIEADALYDFSDLTVNLSIFRTPPQLALLGYEEQKDIEPLAVLIRYMEKHRKVFLLPIVLDENVIGQTLFFPYSCRFQVIGMDLPSELSQPGNLVAAILPYTLLPDQIKHRLPARLKAPEELEIWKPPSPQVAWSKSLRTKPFLHQGLQILGMSPQFYKYLADYRRTYFIWPQARHEYKAQVCKTDRVESLLLDAVLEQTSKLVPTTNDARLIFVHRRSLPVLHKIPGLLERRSRSTSAQFYIFGSHPDLPPNLWNLREIYPWGGIVTFSPFAWRTDPLGVMNRIHQISKHPQWACYILPSALGLLAKLECDRVDPVQDFDNGKLMMDPLLQAIEDGELALLRAPPENLIPANITGHHTAWLEEFLSFSAPRRRDALIVGITAFIENRNLPKSNDIVAAMGGEILSDMSKMQRQPMFMNNYRRFVVIDSEVIPSAITRAARSQGLEWTTISKFDFRDDFFPKQTVGIVPKSST